LTQSFKNSPKKIKGVQGIYIKTPDSIAIPLYNSLPATLRIDATIPSTPIKIEETKIQGKKGTIKSEKSQDSKKKSQQRKKRKQRPILDAHLRKKKKIEKKKLRANKRASLSAGSQAKKE